MNEGEAMGTVTASGEATQPVTLAESKAFLRVDGTDEDAVITSMIAAAVSEAEAITHTRIASRSFIWSHAEPGPLPIHPVSAVSVSVDTGTASGEVSPSLYAFAPSEGTEPAHIEWLDGFPEGEVSVTMAAGYTAQTLPAPIRQWILARVSTFFEQREMFAAGAAHEFGHEFFMALLDPYIIHGGF